MCLDLALYLIQVAIVLGALLCTGIAFNLMHWLLCTLWYVVKGWQTVEKRKFCKILNLDSWFITVIWVFKMFVTFHLSILL